mmetsp:Transcript_165599/g.531509  ORF Transcript_165599/g.531509 Transcript_165599/m.531509 type:complete len:248 (+) Transcript_165599:655-1398(+)
MVPPRPTADRLPLRGALRSARRRPNDGLRGCRGSGAAKLPHGARGRGEALAAPGLLAAAGADLPGQHPAFPRGGGVWGQVGAHRPDDLQGPRTVDAPHRRARPPGLLRRRRPLPGHRGGDAWEDAPAGVVRGQGRTAQAAAGAGRCAPGRRGGAAAARPASARGRPGSRRGRNRAAQMVHARGADAALPRGGPAPLAPAVRGALRLASHLRRRGGGTASAAAAAAAAGAPAPRAAPGGTPRAALLQR